MMARNASGIGDDAGGECDMSSKETAVRFARLHVGGSPLLLCDAADVGSFKAMALAGARHRTIDDPHEHLAVRWNHLTSA